VVLFIACSPKIVRDRVQWARRRSGAYLPYFVKSYLFRLTALRVYSRVAVHSVSLSTAHTAHCTHVKCELSHTHTHNTHVDRRAVARARPRTRPPRWCLVRVQAVQRGRWSVEPVVRAHRVDQCVFLYVTIDYVRRLRGVRREQTIFEEFTVVRAAGTTD
jgi:hypothetical protein